MVTDDSAAFMHKMVNYISEVWNILDVLTILTFIAGIILRVIPISACPECFNASRIVLSINLMTFCFRFLHIFSVHKELGPKLVMIGRMVCRFMTIYIFFD